jgi:hypothetical protein
VADLRVTPADGSGSILPARPGTPAETGAAAGPGAAAGTGPQRGPGRAPRPAVIARLHPRQLWHQHRLFTILVLISLLPRLLAMLAFRPALFTADSFLYMQEATTLRLGVIRPSGYSFFLKLFQVLPDRLVLIVAVQHLLGVATAVIVYALLRYWRLPAWGASLAAAPVLFDTREIALESHILPDTLYTLAIMIVVALLITRHTPRFWQCLLAGLLMAYVTVLRGNGLPLAILVGAFALLRRAGWRAFAAGALAFALPVLGYAGIYQAQHGQFNLTSSDGIFLWSRTTSFANCAVIKPPARLAPLCPARETGVAPARPAPPWSVPALLGEPAPNVYLWASDAWWRHDAHPGINGYNNKLAQDFAVDAITAQPLDYLRVTARDVMLLFLANDRPQTHFTMNFTAAPTIPVLPSYYQRMLRNYSGTSGNTHLGQPYAYLMFLYQLPVYFPGIVFLLAVLAGLAGVIRNRRIWGGPGLLPWVLAAAGIVVPALLTQVLYRYAMAAIPPACVAAGLAFTRISGWQVPGRGPRAASAVAAASVPDRDRPVSPPRPAGGSDG